MTLYLKFISLYIKFLAIVRVKELGATKYNNKSEIFSIKDIALARKRW
jgi:hypothetical protein